jgi:hypothetical protein
MTHHFIASQPPVHRRQSDSYAAVFGRGKGPITITYPDVADPDHVTIDWLKLYRNELPPGTIVEKSGVTFRIEEQP